MEELARTIPVRPPIENKKTNPIDQSRVGVTASRDPWRVAIQLKIFTPVGTAIIIVAAVKYARVSTSIPTVNIWWAQTMKPSSPIAVIA
jgi:hypothetical protein